MSSTSIFVSEYQYCFSWGGAKHYKATQIIFLVFQTNYDKTLKEMQQNVECYIQTQRMFHNLSRFFITYCTQFFPWFTCSVLQVVSNCPHCQPVLLPKIRNETDWENLPIIRNKIGKIIWPRDTFFMVQPAIRTC